MPPTLKAKEVQDKKDKEKEQPNPQMEELKNQLAAVTAELKQSREQQELEKSQEQKLKDAKDLEELKAAADIKALLADAADENGKDDDEDDLSSKEILDAVAGAFDTAITAKLKTHSSDIAEMLKESNNRIENLQKFILQKEVTDRVREARTQFPDFDDFREDIAKVMERYPAMDIADAYVLAKGNKSKGALPRNKVESEKPFSLATRSEEADKSFAAKRAAEAKESSSPEGTGTRSSVRNFRDSLADAVNKVVSERKQ